MERELFWKIQMALIFQKKVGSTAEALQGTAIN